MGKHDRAAEELTSLGKPSGVPLSDTDQTLSDTDQTLSDTDQTLSDTDQTLSDADQLDSAKDQRASDRDQATADRARAQEAQPTPDQQSDYLASREDRQTTSRTRRSHRDDRAGGAVERDLVASQRDTIATTRDDTAHVSVEHATGLRTDTEVLLVRELETLRSAAAADRTRAAADRARAAKDRQDAARERARLEKELRSAHLDGLTGALRREVGHTVIQQEIERARRTDGRFIVAFVDVDRLKLVNDRDGHAAGDRVLQTVVREIQTHLRPYDVVLRYGGDEFVCGLSRIDVDEAEQRFASIAAAIKADADVSISVGLAGLTDGDTVDDLTARADAAMMQRRANRPSSE